MDLVQLAKDALVLFQQIQPGVKAAIEVGTAVGSMGSAAVQVIQKGKQLVTYVIQRVAPKPPITAPESLADQTPTPLKDVAVLVDINRRMLVDVARYLDEKKIDAELMIVTNDPAYSDQIKFLDPNKSDEWKELVKEFTAAMNAVKREAGGARLHIFLSTPLPLAFGLGSVWGTVDVATIYHWQEVKGEKRSTYYPSMEISRELR
jgi:hypothetical protein